MHRNYVYLTCLFTSTTVKRLAESALLDHSRSGGSINNSQGYVSLNDGFDPAPSKLPADLLFLDDGKFEYVPEMPRAFEGFNISAPLQICLEHLVERKLCSIEDIDSRAITELSTLPEAAAISVLNEFATCDRYFFSYSPEHSAPQN